jgi:CelD/BcsL family acetyltransferase involved in cellulose biosynthesis
VSVVVRTEERFPRGDEAAAWEHLVDLDPAATVFHSARFLRLWCRHLRGDCDLRIRTVLRDDEMIGVIPEVREDVGVRTVHFAGGEHVTDYLGPIGRVRDRREIATAWVDALVGEDDWDEVRADGLAEDAGWHELLAGAADRAGLVVDGPDVDDVCPRIDLSGGWDGYLNRLSSKHRHEIRRKARRISREASVIKLEEVDPGDVASAMDEFVALHRRSPGEKGTFFDRPGMKDFFHGLAEEFAPARTLRIHRLIVDDVTAASTISLVHGGNRSPREWGVYNSAFEPDLGSLAPGMVLIGELIRIACEDRCDVLDLLRGEEPYKYRFGAEDRRVRRLVLRRGTG